MASPYKRRRPSILGNLWVYRRLVLAAMVLGLVLWFIVINNTPVVVYFPFGFGEIHTRSGLAILLGFFAGSIVTGLIITVLFTLRRNRLPGVDKGEREEGLDPRGRDDWGDDRPPSDYAANTPEGFSDAPWNRG